MLPSLRLSLGAMIATFVVVLAASAGLVATRDPSRGFVDIPDVNRTLVQKAIMEEPEWQHFHLLAYARRTDELQRLLDLPVTPVPAIVEAVPPLAESPVETTVVSEPAPPPAEPAEESGAAQIALHTEPPPQAAPAPLAAAPAPPAPVAAEPAPADEPTIEALLSDQTVATAAISATPAAPFAAPVPLPRPRVETAAARTTKKQVATKPARKAKVARTAARKTTAAAARTAQRAQPTASTSFPVELPKQSARNNQRLFPDTRDR